MPPNPRDRFAFICQMEWDELEPTDNPAVRFCSQCKRSVTHAKTDGEFEVLATEGHCLMWQDGRGMTLIGEPIPRISWPEGKVSKEEDGDDDEP